MTNRTSQWILAAGAALNTALAVAWLHYGDLPAAVLSLALAALCFVLWVGLDG